jgi:ATP-binding cassette subfamily B protein
LRQDGLLPLGLLVAALAVTAASGIVEILLLRGMLDIGQRLGSDQRMAALAVLFTFAVGVLFLQLPVQTTILRIGRRLETRMRVAFLSKIPRLNDRYFQSRLISDMTQRARDLSSLGGLPRLGATFIQTVFQLVLTLFAVIILDPKSLFIAFLATVSAVALSIISNPFLVEQDLRLRTHIAALSRFYLDSLLGLVTIRTHGAERTVRREHEGLLVEWARTSFAMVRTNLIVEGVSGLVSTLFSVWLLLNYIAQGGSASGVLLIFFWTLNLPRLGQQLTQLIQQYPLQRNRILRFLEPLGAPEDSYAAAIPAADAVAAEAGVEAGDDPEQAPPAVGAPAGAEAAIVPAGGEAVSPPGPVGLVFDQVTVQAAGHTILRDVNFDLAPGSHLAVVGASGAGKSSLVGLLLGWHRPASGRLLVDGLPLTEAGLRRLRRETAWVDPAIQLWNRTFVDNLRYGADDNNPAAMSGVIEQADLLEVLERMPSGLQTPLGEGGGLVSGGEGQRVRLGRAMLRPGARLVILDEPFRGLDRTKRRELLARARQVWAGATLICITHDVSQTLDFERVLVIDDGRIVEDAGPGDLVNQPDSRYSGLLQAEQAVHESLWASASWRRLYMAEGRLTEQTAGEEAS